MKLKQTTKPKIKLEDGETITYSNKDSTFTGEYDIPAKDSPLKLHKNILSLWVEDSIFEIEFEPKDIRNLMKWQMGQDEYNENQKKQEEKDNLKTILDNVEIPQGMLKPDKDIENQKIVDEKKSILAQLYGTHPSLRKLVDNIMTIDEYPVPEIVILNENGEDIKDL